jgi:hypothetical protein
MTTKKTSGKANAGSQPVHRFAHPFFTTTPPAKRTTKFNGATRMTGYIKDHLEAIPSYGKASLIMTLDQIVGSAAATQIANTGKLIFHSTGDTGAPVHGDMQTPVSDAMGAEYDINNPAASPAFFLHLGDVIYYDNTSQGYRQQFYNPYMKYPGKIIAIPGNHDGEMHKFNQANQPPTGQKFSLAAFIENFCQPNPGVPPAAGTIYRQMVNQPGVYWWLQTPFADIVGLYSNVAEGPGYLVTQTDDSQEQWLLSTLKSIAKQRKPTDTRHKALLIAVHHPPYSQGGHESSTDMLAEIDQCCQGAGILPDAVLSGHAHNIQHFERKVGLDNQQVQIPYIVCGSGGHNADKVVLNKVTLQKPIPANVLVKKSLVGYGYLTVTVDNAKLNINVNQVTVDSATMQEKSTLFDSAQVNLTGSNLGTNFSFPG